MLIRQPVVEDAPAVAAVHARSWRAAYRGLLPDAALAELSEASLETMWRRRFERRAPVVFIAEEGGTVIGWVSLEVSQGVGEILGLYVDPAAWSTGVGGALMSRALDALREAKAERVEVWVLAGNGRARRFYAASGFAPVEQEERVAQRHGASLPEVKYKREVP